MYYIYNENHLAHHGVLGQKWGVRRYQNPDGTLTEAGKKRLGKDSAKFTREKKTFDRKGRRYAKANARFKRRAKRFSLTDTGVELKRRAGLKLARRYRAYTRSGKRLQNHYYRMVKRYGVNSLSKEQIAIGSEVTERLLKTMY